MHEQDLLTVTIKGMKFMSWLKGVSNLGPLNLYSLVLFQLSYLALVFDQTSLIVTFLPLK